MNVIRLLENGSDEDIENDPKIRRLLNDRRVQYIMADERRMEEAEKIAIKIYSAPSKVVSTALKNPRVVWASRRASERADEY